MRALVEADLDRLTDEQLIAAGTAQQRIYIQAAPGSGKTTVSAHRFGLQRFTPIGDHRAVVAVSFTRSATAELRHRVLARWGFAALTTPHRIVTLDTLVHDLLAHLLHTGTLHWPADHCELEVIDTWKARFPTAYAKREPALRLEGRHVVTGYLQHAGRDNRIGQGDFDAAIAAGQCTHADVRRVLELALTDPDIAARLVEYFATTTRALIVDEIFDANALDLTVVELAARAGLNVTVVGDPWQALYGFRGARPDLVPALIDRAALTELALQTSFRWRTQTQAQLALALRQGVGTTVPSGLLADADVVLAREWKALWQTAPHVLPLAFKSANGNVQEAASTLLLNQMTRRTFGEHATYLNDALITLQVTDSEARARLEPLLAKVLARLAGGEDLPAILQALTAAVATESPRTMPRRHHEHITRLEQLRARLRLPDGGLIPGLTAHQAKGREWTNVAVHLTPSDTHALERGLESGNEDHRRLYVALTRAARRSFTV